MLAGTSASTECSRPAPTSCDVGTAGRARVIAYIKLRDGSKVWCLTAQYILYSRNTKGRKSRSFRAEVYCSDVISEAAHWLRGSTAAFYWLAENQNKPRVPPPLWHLTWQSKAHSTKLRLSLLLLLLMGQPIGCGRKHRAGSLCKKLSSAATLRQI